MKPLPTIKEYKVAVKTLLPKVYCKRMTREGVKFWYIFASKVSTVALGVSCFNEVGAWRLAAYRLGFFQEEK